MDPNKPQPAPIKNDSRPIWELVVEDMQARDRTGEEKYGVRLQANNGRDALMDAYQEALDLVVYLRQAIEERRLALGSQTIVEHYANMIRHIDAQARLMHPDYGGCDGLGENGGCSECRKVMQSYWDGMGEQRSL